jgi:hypothetical protein
MSAVFVQAVYSHVSGSLTFICCASPLIVECVYFGQNVVVGVLLLLYFAPWTLERPAT